MKSAPRSSVAPCCPALVLSFVLAILVIGWALPAFAFLADPEKDLQ